MGQYIENIVITLIICITIIWGVHAIVGDQEVIIERLPICSLDKMTLGQRYMINGIEYEFSDFRHYGDNIDLEFDVID